MGCGAPGSMKLSGSASCRNSWRGRWEQPFGGQSRVVMGRMRILGKNMALMRGVEGEI